jgi:hypothetical protein
MFPLFWAAVGFTVGSAVLLRPKTRSLCGLDDATPGFKRWRHELDVKTWWPAERRRMGVR